MVLTFGELLLRLAAPGYTRLFQKDSFDVTFCGAEANVAVSLANFGIQTKYVTVLPDNEIGIAAINSLKYFGVDTSDIIKKDGRMGLFYLEKGASQRASKVIYDRAYSAIAFSKSGDYNWEEIFLGVKWFHFTGITPALSDDLAEICLDACKIAKEKGITISCDLNYRAKLWSTDKAKIVMTKIMNYVDVCFANEEDADKVLGIKSDKTNISAAVLDHKGYEDVAKHICDEFNCRYVAISLRKSYSASHNGWNGMLYDGVSRQAFYSNEYDIQIVDRVGAGDSFSAGIIYGLISNKSFADTVDFAVASSCLKHSIEGDFNRVTVTEIDYLIKNGGNGRVSR